MSRELLRWSPCVCLFALAAACASTDVDGEDEDALFAHGRVVFDFDDRELPSVEAGDARRFQHGVELDFGGTSGTLDVSDGFGEADCLALRGSLAYRAGMRLRRAELYGLVGFAGERIELSENPALDGGETFLGPMVGAELRIRVRDWFAPYLRLTASSLEQASYSRQIEGGLSFRPAPDFDLFVAYRDWSAEYGELGPADRDLDLQVSGLLLGFAVRL